MLEYDPHMQEVLEDPYPIYRRLRDEAPVYHVESYDACAFSRFADQWALTQDDVHLTAREGTTPHYFGARPIELPGYKEYAERVHYRLLPGVW